MQGRQRVYMKNQQKFYNIENLLESKCEYNILLGERSNGKSYATKYMTLWESFNEEDYLSFKKAGKHIPKTRYMFGYIRRWREEIKTKDIEQYFADMPIEEITNGEYNTIVCFRGSIYYAKNEDGVIERGKQIGYTFALTGVTHYKSLAYPKIGNVIYEEFITNQGYLPHEVDNLMDIISTIARREYVRVFLIGNTISRLCPYFDEWQLTHVKKQKQGTIDIYHQPTNQVDDGGNNIVVKIAVEYCENSGKNSKMFFGKKSEMITSGVWDSNNYPHLEYPLNHYRCVYKILYEYKTFRFIINLLLSDNNEPFLYIYPATKDNANIKRVVTDKYSIDRYTTTYLTDLCRYDNIVVELIKNNKICFSDNLSGTEFEQIRKERGVY